MSNPMEEEPKNQDIVDLTKENKKMEEEKPVDPDLNRILNTMDKESEANQRENRRQQRIDQMNLTVPWIEHHKRFNIITVDKNATDESKKFIKIPAIEKYLGVKFRHQIFNKSEVITETLNDEEIKKESIRKENEVMRIVKSGLNQKELIGNKDLKKIEIQFLVEYKVNTDYLNTDEDPVFYIVTISKWDVNIRIKRLPMVEFPEIKDFYLPVEYQSEPKEFNNIWRRKKTIFIPRGEYDRIDKKTGEKVHKTWQGSPVERTKLIVNEELLKKKKEWERERDKLMKEIREKRKAKELERKRLMETKPKRSDIKEKMEKINKRKEVINKELIKLNVEIAEESERVVAGMEKLGPNDKEQREQLQKYANSLVSKKNEYFEEQKELDQDLNVLKRDYSESIKDETEVSMMPKYEMISVDVEQYVKDDTYGYIKYTGKKTMTMPGYDKMKKRIEKRDKELQTAIDLVSRGWSQGDSDYYDKIVKFLKDVGDIKDIIMKCETPEDLNKLSDEEIERFVNVLTYFESNELTKDVEFSRSPENAKAFEDAQKIKNVIEEMEETKEKMETFHKDLEKYNEYLPKYDKYMGQMQKGSLQEDGREWIKNNPEVLLPKLGEYEKIDDDYYSNSVKLEVTPKGSVVKRKGEDKELETDVITLDINVGKGEKKSYIGVYLTPEKGYINMKLDEEVDETFKEIMKRGEIKQISCSLYIEKPKKEKGKEEKKMEEEEKGIDIDIDIDME